MEIQQLVDFKNLRSWIGIFPLSFLVQNDIALTPYYYMTGDDKLVVGLEAATSGNALQVFETTTIRSEITPEDVSHLEELLSGQITTLRLGNIEFVLEGDIIQISRQYEYEAGTYWCKWFPESGEARRFFVDKWAFKRYIVDYLDIAFKCVTVPVQ